MFGNFAVPFLIAYTLATHVNHSRFEGNRPSFLFDPLSRSWPFWLAPALPASHSRRPST